MTGDLSVYDLYRDMENLRKRINILENKIFPDPELQKKFKDCKFKASEFVRLTVSQYRKLYKEFGKRMVRRFIKVLNNYKAAKGAVYKSDYHAILNWVIKKVMEEEAKDVSNMQKR